MESDDKLRQRREEKIEEARRAAERAREGLPAPESGNGTSHASRVLEMMSQPVLAESARVAVIKQRAIPEASRVVLDALRAATDIELLEELLRRARSDD